MTCTIFHYSNIHVYMCAKLSKAFDTVNHSLLPKKLAQVGVSPPAVEWFKSYLSDHSQFIIINNIKSEPDTTLAGVPHGSILGPSLFVIHVNDQPLSCPTCTDASTIVFAHDTTIHTTGTSVYTTDQVHPFISTDQRCNNWMTDSKPRLYLSKTKCMLIHSSKLDPPPLDIYLARQVSTFKLLGCIIDHHLTWNSHIQYISGKVLRSINLLHQLSWF